MSHSATPRDCSTPGLPVHYQLWVYSNSRPLSQWCHPTMSSSVIPFFSCLQSFSASWCLRNCNQSYIQTTWKMGLPSKVGKDTVEHMCRGLVLGSLELTCLLDFSGKRPGRQFCSWDQKTHFLQISFFCSKLQFFLSWLTFRNERGENEKCTRKSI